MKEIKRVEIDHKGLPFFDDKGVYVFYEDYAALQQKLDAVLAENLALKSGVKYFSYSEFSGFEEHATAKLAMESADADLAGERDEASSEGWSEETSTICWGIICQKAVEDKFEQPSEENGWVGWSDFTLTPSLKTPATDAILNEVRAEAELEGMVRGAGRVALEASRVYRDAPTRSEERSLHKRIGDFAHMIARRIRAEEATND